MDGDVPITRVDHVAVVIKGSETNVAVCTRAVVEMGIINGRHHHAVAITGQDAHPVRGAFAPVLVEEFLVGSHTLRIRVAVQLHSGVG